MTVRAATARIKTANIAFRNSRRRGMYGRHYDNSWRRPYLRMNESYFGLRLLLVVLIVAVNGFFAAAEVSLISVRQSRLRQMGEEGQAGARAALSLLANPERLLSVTQVGVTLASLGLGWAGEDTLYQLILRLVHPVITPVSAGLIHGAGF